MSAGSDRFTARLLDLCAGSTIVISFSCLFGGETFCVGKAYTQRVVMGPYYS
jgi:hypothetical protein